MDTQTIFTFLTFNGIAQQAMEFYAEKLPDAKIESLTLFEEGTPNGDAGKVLNGTLSYGGQNILFMDMQAAFPAPEFTWATSFLINCKNEMEFDTIFKNFSETGKVLMGPEPIMHLRNCAWLTDKFGVTWQLVWE